MQKIDLIKWPEQTLACILKEYPLGEIPHYLDTTDLIPENFEMFFQKKESSVSNKYYFYLDVFSTTPRRHQRIKN